MCDVARTQCAHHRIDDVLFIPFGDDDDDDDDFCTYHLCVVCVRVCVCVCGEICDVNRLAFQSKAYAHLDITTTEP